MFGWVRSSLRSQLGNPVDRGSSTSNTAATNNAAQGMGWLGKSNSHFPPQSQWWRDTWSQCGCVEKGKQGREVVGLRADNYTMPGGLWTSWQHGLRTGVSNDIPWELFIGRCSCWPHLAKSPYKGCDGSPLLCPKAWLCPILPPSCPLVPRHWLLSPAAETAGSAFPALAILPHLHWWRRLISAQLRVGGQ